MKIYYKLLVNFIEWEEFRRPDEGFERNLERAIERFSLAQSAKIIGIMIFIYYEIYNRELKNIDMSKSSIVIIGTIIAFILNRIVVLFNRFISKDNIEDFYIMYHRKDSIGIFSQVYRFISVFIPLIVLLLLRS